MSDKELIMVALDEYSDLCNVVDETGSYEDLLKIYKGIYKNTVDSGGENCIKIRLKSLIARVYNVEGVPAISNYFDVIDEYGTILENVTYNEAYNKVF